MTDTTPFVQFLQSLLMTFVTLATPVVVAYVIVLIKQLLDRVKTGMTAERWLLLQSLASVVVSAAEQSGLSGQISQLGKDKKAWAIDQLGKLADAHGLHGLDFAALSNVIEAEVLRQFNQEPQPVPLLAVSAAAALH